MPKLEELEKLLSGEDGEARNGISISRRSAMKLWDGDYHYYAKEHPDIKRYTLACVEGQYTWLEVIQGVGSILGSRTFSDKLEEQASEEDAKYILRYGRFEEGAGEV